MVGLDYCLDTSAINALHDDPDRETLVTGLLTASRVLTTALNVIEIGKSTDFERGRSLLRLLHRMAKNLRPLELPNELLIRSIVAAKARETEFSALVEDRSVDLWNLMCDPDQLAEDVRADFIKWSNENENGLLRANANARPEFQRAFEAGERRPQTAAKWIKAFWKEEERVFGRVAPFYQFATSTDLQRSELGPLLSVTPELKLYLSAWLFASHRQAIRTENYSAKRNAGMMDLLCVAYLPRCDVFLTKDVQQRRALRILAPFSPNRPQIQSYSHFRRRLLVL